MRDAKTIFVVGQCGVDGPRIQDYLEGCDPSFRVQRLQSEAELEDPSVARADLILFNRELVGDFDSPEGVELIRALRERYPEVKMMLVSDLDEAQSAAIEAGAVPGFGKRDLESDRVGDVVRSALS